MGLAERTPELGRVDYVPACSESGRPESGLSFNPSLQPLSQLIANSTEAHTAALFRAHQSSRTLQLVSAQTLSRELVPGAAFNFGQGLVGWVAENATKITVCPFEHDATTLMYYSRDQELKSFIAVPIFSSAKELIGVLACDSKKSYAFPKIAEKVLADCAVVAGQFFEMQDSKRPNQVVSRTLLEQILDTLRSQQDERALLSAASDLPAELIARDALVVLCLSENGTGQGVFYSKASQSKANNRLLEMVCKHKRLISRERSVQAIQGDELGRAFLSVPFRVLGREAGSLNLLSLPEQTFSLEQVNSLERIGIVIGHELERLRLASLFSRQTSLSDWKSFELRANLALKDRRPLALLRFVPKSLSAVEARFGAAASLGALQKFSRLLEQLRGTEGLLCSLHGSDFLLLCSADERTRIVRRLETMLRRNDGDANPEIMRVFSEGLSIVGAVSGPSTPDVAALSRKTIELLYGSQESSTQDKTTAELLSRAAVNDWKW